MFEIKLVHEVLCSRKEKVMMNVGERLMI